MQDTVVLDGYLDLEITEKAECDLLIPESGEVGVFTALREVYPAYTGPMEIVPSSESQVLDTTFKSMLGDVVIHPIPSNYGLITWNGSTLTVS